MDAEQTGADPLRQAQQRRERAAALLQARQRTQQLAAENAAAIQELVRMRVSPNLVALKLDLLVEKLFPSDTETRVLWDLAWEETANAALVPALSRRRQEILLEGLGDGAPMNVRG